MLAAVIAVSRFHVVCVQTYCERNCETHARCQLSASAVELMDPIGHGMKAEIVLRNTSFIVLALDSVQVVARGFLIMSLKLGGFSDHTLSRPLLFGHVEGHMSLRLTLRGVRERYGINNRWDQGVAPHSLLDGRSMMGFYTIAKESRGCIPGSRPEGHHIGAGCGS